MELKMAVDWVVLSEFVMEKHRAVHWAGTGAGPTAEPMVCKTAAGSAEWKA